MEICPYCEERKKLVALTLPTYIVKGSSGALQGTNICADCKRILDENGEIISVSGEIKATVSRI